MASNSACNTRLSGVQVIMAPRGALSNPHLKWGLVTKGIELGKKDGIQQGMQQGIQEGIQILIATCKEFGATFAETCVKLKEKYLLDDAEIQKDMALYW